MSDLTKASVLISGLVQGVFFRYSTQIQAKTLGVRGWVKNRPDGKVEAIFEGEREKVKQLINWCKHGPQGARVGNVIFEWQEFQNEFSDFRIK